MKDPHNFTARPRKWLPSVAGWVTEHSGLPTVVDISRARAYWLTRGTVLITSTKLGAAAYVDDRAVHRAGDWTTTLAVLTRAIGLDRAGGAPTI